MREFYVDVMGFPVYREICMETDTPQPDGEPTISFLTVSHPDTPLGRNLHPQLLVLIDYQRHVFAKEQFKGHDVTKSTLNHVAFEIAPEDFQSHASRLRELGITVRLADFPDLCARAMFFNDPENNLLELICHHADQTPPSCRTPA